MVEVNCSHRIAQDLLEPLSSSSFVPRSPSRRTASSLLSPDPASVPRARSTSPASEVCQAPSSPLRRLSIRRFPLGVSSTAKLARPRADTDRDFESRQPHLGPRFACRHLRNLPSRRGG